MPRWRGPAKLTASDDPKPQVAASRALRLLLVVPALAHVTATGGHFLTARDPVWTGGDTAAALAVAAYLACAFLAAHNARSARRLALLVSSTLLALALLEGGLVLSSPSEDLPWPPLERVSTAGEHMPGIRGEIVFSTTWRGVRAPDLWPPDPADRVLCVGGSTTECLYVTDERSWPWLTGTLLSQAFDRQVLVANAGLSGQFSEHHLQQLRSYTHVREFGTVVVLCGVNDLGTLLHGDLAARSQSAAAEALLVRGGLEREGPYYRRLLLLERLSRALGTHTNQERTVVQDPAGDYYAEVRAKRQLLLAQNTIRDLPAGLDQALLAYRSRIRRLTELCRSRGQRVIFMTQPTLWHAGLSPEQRALLWQHTEQGAHTPELLARLLGAFNAALAAECLAAEVPCLDLAAALPQDTSVFYDDCHFNEGGCQRVAELLSEVLARELRQTGSSGGD